MEKPTIRAGERLDIVFENELHQAKAHFLKAVVYDVEGSLLTVSQTSPPLGRQFMDRKVRVTYLVRTENRIQRLGVQGKLMGLIADYAIASGKTVEALQIRMTTRPAPTDFRMYFRVSPPSDADICLYREEEKVSLLDISIGGARFSHPKTFVFQPGDLIALRLIMDKAVFDIEARVRNVREPEASLAKRDIQFVSVEFQHADPKTEAALGRAILDIERALLSEGRG